MSKPPAHPKIFHIVHVDRLASIASDQLWCDAEAHRRSLGGPMIGVSSIKERRLSNSLASHRGLQVGECVPFYFCPRSVMLYVIHMANHDELAYRGGQRPIVHLEADFREAIAWAGRQRPVRRWAFTTSNAGSYYFDDYSDPADLDKVDWTAVHANQWAGQRK